MTTEQLLREALRKIKYEAVSLADAQVIALEVLSHPSSSSGEVVAWELHAIKFANGKKLTYEKPENLPSYLGARALVYADATPPASQPQADHLRDAAKMVAQAAWQPIETAPENMTGVVVVRWKDSEGNEQHDFDYTEDGCWMKWHEHAEHVQMIGGHGVSYTPPYTHFMEIPPCINGLEVKP
jgi:hypothetical protein